MYGLLGRTLLATIAWSVVVNAQHGTANDDTVSGSGSTGPVTKPTSALLGAAGASTYGNGTCVSRTANYITHTLPQQCLRTDRVHANATHMRVTVETFGEGEYGARLERELTGFGRWAE